MKNLVTFVGALMLSSIVFGANSKVLRKPSSDNSSAQVADNPAINPCFKEARQKAIDLESKPGEPATVVKTDTGNEDVRYLGGGVRLFLYSVFVTSQHTPDNTHWEIVEQMVHNVCKTIASSRTEAP